MNGIHNALSITVCEDANDAIMNGFNWAVVPEIRPIRIKKVIVVKNGTVEGNPTVDFLLEDETGKQFVFMLTGRLLKSIPCEVG